MSWVVHHVESGTEASTNSLEVWSVVVRVDNKEFASEESLFEYLKHKSSKDEEVVLSIKQFSLSGTKVFDYLEITLSVSDLHEESIKDY